MRRTLILGSIGFLLAACNSASAPSSVSSGGSAPGASASAASPASSAASSPAPAAPTAAAANASPANAATPVGGALHLGAPITESKTVTLSDIVKHPKQYEGNVVATTGTVFAVCQAMGCWMEIKDDANTEAHVRLAGHAFFVPKTSSGHHARVQAKVMRTDPDSECAEEAAQQTGKPVAKLELEATGVELE